VAASPKASATAVASASSNIAAVNRPVLVLWRET